MHRRCCWPPDSAVPLSCSRSLTSSHRPARFSDFSTISSSSRLRAARGRGCAGRRRHSRRSTSGTDWASGTPCRRGRGAGPRPCPELVMSSPSSSIRPRHARRGDGVVHPVEAAQERRLAAARRADEGGDEVVVDLDRDVLERLLVAIEDADVVGAHLRFAAGVHGVGAGGFDSAMAKRRPSARRLGLARVHVAWSSHRLGRDRRRWRRHRRRGRDRHFFFHIHHQRRSKRLRR